jgi:RND superfamily putative drug exporter
VRFVAAVLRWLRWPIALAWIGGAVACLVLLPPIHGSRGGDLGALVPEHAAALHAELVSETQFGFPVLSRTIVVERDPHGLSAAEQARVVARAGRLTAHTLPGFERIAGALPVLNTVGPPGFVRERGTTALTRGRRRADEAQQHRAEGEEESRSHVLPTCPALRRRCRIAGGRRAHDVGDAIT